MLGKKLMFERRPEPGPAATAEPAADDAGTKIISLHELADRASKLRRHGKTVVLCHGTFDLLHIGHIRHLERARREGDVLMVTITADAHVNKGPGRPVFSQNLRAEHLAALQHVDYVAVNDGPTAVNVIEIVMPNVYVKGGDYQQNEDDVTGNIVLERRAVESYGGRILYTDELTFSSSKLLNEHFCVFSPETKDYLSEFRHRYTDEQVIDRIKALQKLKILVVGDAIVDEYHYSTPLGQTGKYNVLAVKYQNQERFAGGAIAVANHIAGFVNGVGLFSGLGSVHSHEDFIHGKLKANVAPRFLRFKDAPTLVKRRFVDQSMAKLFEVYFYNDMPIDPSLEREACAWLEEHVAEYDVVVVPDFGNGFITQGMIEVLCDKARYLAVNTQLNSGNRGYHVISRYPRADFISLNEPELRLAAHNRHGPLRAIAEQVAGGLDAAAIAVTRGTQGLMLLDRAADRLYEVPALSTKVVDRIGAGDAFLAVAGTALGGGLEPELAAFIGSAAAALDVQIVCNREVVEPASLCKYVTTLLK